MSESPGRKTRPDAHESVWLAALDDEDPTVEVAPGVTNADLRSFHTRPRTPAGVRFRLHLRYGQGGDRPLLLSLYARANPDERRPSVIFIHGGGWCSGDPYWHIRHAHGLAARGYVTATIAYRLYPEVRWPAPLEDVKAAVRWMRANAHRFGADPEAIVVAGGSAGGQLAAMAALTPGRLEGNGGNPDVTSAVQGAVLWYPSVDLTRRVFPPDQKDQQAVVEDFFGQPLRTNYDASPAHQVTSGAPPILTITGSADPVARLVVVRDFHRSLDEHGVVNRLEVLEGRVHAYDLTNWADWQTSFDLMATFLDDYFPADAQPKSQSAIRMKSPS